MGAGAKGKVFLSATYAGPGVSRPADGDFAGGAALPYAKAGELTKALQCRATLLGRTPLGELVWIDHYPIHPFPAVGRFLAEVLEAPEALLVAPGEIVLFIPKQNQQLKKIFGSKAWESHKWRCLWSGRRVGDQPRTFGEALDQAAASMRPRKGINSGPRARQGRKGRD